MRKPRSKLVSRTTGQRGTGPPRVIEDVELYHQIMANTADRRCGKGDLLVRELSEMVREMLTCMPDWGVQIMALRAQLFLGCIRKELGRRSQLNPNQLRLQKGM